MVLTKHTLTHSGVATQDPPELEVDEVRASGGFAVVSEPVGLPGGEFWIKVNGFGF